MNERQFTTNPALLGAQPSPRDFRDYVAMPAMAEEYPESFSIDLGIPVKNQSGAGSCVAHSLSELVEFYTLQQENQKVRMSTNYIYGNRENSTYKGSGMIVRDAIKNLASLGDLPYELYPGNTEVPKCIEEFTARSQDLDKCAYPNRVSEYYRLVDDNAIKSHLLHVGPVVAVMQWPTSYVLKGTEALIVNTAGTNCGGHCIVIYGWNKDGWLFRNSWGADWGNNGNAVWPFAYSLWEAWGIIDNVTGEYKAMEVKRTTKWQSFLQSILKTLRAVVEALRAAPTNK